MFCHQAQLSTFYHLLLARQQVLFLDICHLAFCTKLQRQAVLKSLHLIWFFRFYYPALPSSRQSLLVWVATLSMFLFKYTLLLPQIIPIKIRQSLLVLVCDSIRVFCLNTDCHCYKLLQQKKDASIVCVFYFILLILPLQRVRCRHLRQMYV